MILSPFLCRIVGHDTSDSALWKRTHRCHACHALVEVEDDGPSLYSRVIDWLDERLARL
jgi:hypothetical protein